MMRRSTIALLLLAVVALIGGLAMVLHATPFYLTSVDRFDPNTIPFPYDKGQVVGEILGTVTQKTGVTANIQGGYGDPDADPVTVRLSKAPSDMLLKQDPNSGTYTLTWTPTAVGLYYVAVTAKDQPPSGDPLETTGTIIWNVQRQNHSPFLAPVGNLTAAN